MWYDFEMPSKVRTEKLLRHPLGDTIVSFLEPWSDVFSCRLYLHLAVNAGQLHDQKATCSIVKKTGEYQANCQRLQLGSNRMRNIT